MNKNVKQINLNILYNSGLFIYTVPTSISVGRKHTPVQSAPESIKDKPLRTATRATYPPTKARFFGKELSFLQSNNNNCRKTFPSKY